MYKIRFLLFTIVGAAAAICGLNMLLDMNYSNDGSFDIVTGALVEVFVLTVFFEYAAARSRKKHDDFIEKQHKKIMADISAEHKQIRSILEDVLNHISKTAEAYHMQRSMYEQDKQDKQTYSASIAERIQAESDEMAAAEWEEFKKQIKNEMQQRGVNNGN